VTCISILDLAIGNVDYYGGHRHFRPKPSRYNINLYETKVKPGKMKKHKKQQVVHKNFYSYPKYDYPHYVYPTYVHNQYIHKQPSLPQNPKVYMNEGYVHPNYQEGFMDIRTYNDNGRESEKYDQKKSYVYDGWKNRKPEMKGHKDIYTYFNDNISGRSGHSPQKDQKMHAKVYTYTQHYPLYVDQNTNAPGSDVYSLPETFKVYESNLDEKATFKDSYRYDPVVYPSHGHESESVRPIYHADKQFYQDDHGDIYAYDKRKLCEKVCQPLQIYS
jgi:hypothetical protein